MFGCDDMQEAIEEWSTACNDALCMIECYGGVDGEHHKQWVLDQVVRLLTITPEQYERWVKSHNAGEDWPDTYEWKEGIAPWKKDTP